MLRSLELELLQVVAGLNMRPTLDKAGHAGRLLQLARDELPYGHWLPFLKRVGLSKQTASVYMQVHTHTGNVQPAGRSMTIKQFLTQIRKAGREVRHAERVARLASLPAAGTVPGLHHGHALQFMRRMPAGSVDAVVTDPPFGVGIQYDTWTEPRTPNAYWRWFAPHWREMCRVVKPGGPVVVCQAYKYIHHFRDWFGPAIVVTARSYSMRSQQFWSPVVRWSSTPVTVLSGDTLQDNANDGERDALGTAHPCPMTLVLARLLVKRYTTPGMVVLDPFAGTGSVGVAAQELGRDFTGVERSERYFELAQRRLNTA